MRFFYVIALCCVVAGEARAARVLQFQDMLAAAEMRRNYVEALAPGIATTCLAQQWGNNPPLVLRDWLTALFLSDLGNRAKVHRHEMSAQTASELRERQFFTLENLKPEEFETVAAYARFTPEDGFGAPLMMVLDCQYRALGNVLRAEQAPL